MDCSTPGLPEDVLFIIGDWNAKVGSQEIPGVIGKFGLGVQNEAGQRLNRVLQRERTGHSKHPLPTTATLMEDWTCLGQHKRQPEFPVVTRESRRNSRKTTWLPRHRKMIWLLPGWWENSRVPHFFLPWCWVLGSVSLVLGVWVTTQRSSYSAMAV